LHRIPWSAHGRRIAQVKIQDAVDGHRVEQGGRENGPLTRICRPSRPASAG
jgi:hypothetical protein